MIYLYVLVAVNSSAQTIGASLSTGSLNQAGFLENKGQILDQSYKVNASVRFLLSGQGINVQLRQNSFSYDTYESIAERKINPRPQLDLLHADKPLTPQKMRFHRVDVDFPDANPSPEIIKEDAETAYTVTYNTSNPSGITAYRFRRIIYKEMYPGIDLIFDSRDLEGKKKFEYYFVVKQGADPGKIKIRYKGGATALLNGKIVITVSGGRIEERIPASFTTDKPFTVLTQLKGSTFVKTSFRKLGNNTYAFTLSKYDRKHTLVLDPTPELIWGTYLGGDASGSESFHAVTNTGDGNLLLAGGANSANLATSGAYQTTMDGPSDGLLAKFTPDGSLLWVTYYGGESFDFIYSACSDKTGNIFITGMTDSKTGISTPGSHQPVHGETNNATRDGFVAKFDKDGSRIWASFFGGEDGEEASGIAIDAANENIFIVGYTYSQVGISSPGAFQEKWAGWADAFLASFSVNGQLNWSTYYGGAEGDGFQKVIIGDDDNIYTAGGSASTSAIATPESHQPLLAGFSDILIAKFNKGGQRIWATYYGGELNEMAYAIVYNKQGQLIVAGSTNSTKGIATTGAYQTNFVKELDGFVAKFDKDGKRLWGTYYGGEWPDEIFAAATDQDNNIFIGGYAQSTFNIVTSNAFQTEGDKAFVAKLTNDGQQVWGTFYGDRITGWGTLQGMTAYKDGSVYITGLTSSFNKIATCGAVQTECKSCTHGGDAFIAKIADKPPVAASLTIVARHTGFCPGQVVTFTALPVNMGSTPSFQWKINGVSVDNQQALSFTSNTLSNNDLVSCTVKNSPQCATAVEVSSNILKMDVLPSVVPSVTLAPQPSGEVCPGTMVTFTASPVNGGDNPHFQWLVNGNAAGVNSPVFATSTLKQSDKISCVLTNTSSCNPIVSDSSDPISIQINQSPQPSVSVTASADEACPGAIIAFTASASGPGNLSSFRWAVNGDSVAAGQSFSSTQLHDGDKVTCALLPGASFCGGAPIFADPILVKIFPEPTFSITPAHAVISPGDSLRLSATAIANVSSFNWLPVQDISSAVVPNPIVWPDASRQYILQAVSADGCMLSKAVTIEVITAMKIPNAFSPNGDGINDTWRIAGWELFPKCLVRVFDRYGQIVYDAESYTTPWNGSRNGSPLPMGAYFYIIDLKNGAKPLTGSIMLVR